MNAKDTLIGTTKRLVAEVVSDGALADEGSLQINGMAPLPYMDDVSGHSPPGHGTTISNASAMTEDDRFALLGHAALSAWPDLPRDAQERLFAAAVDNETVANADSIRRYGYRHAQRRMSKIITVVLT